MSFYCKIGDIETTIPWNRPNLTTLKEWYLDWVNTPGINNFEIYVVGNFAENVWGGSEFETWDCDIVLIGDITNNIELKNIMNEAVRIGFEKRILIDIWHNSSLLNFEVFSPLIQTRSFLTFHKEKDGEIYTHTFSHFKEIEGGLYQASITTPSKSCIKAMDRYKEGTYGGIQKPIEEILNET
jgi:hypothetical protein